MNNYSNANMSFLELKQFIGKLLRTRRLWVNGGVRFVPNRYCLLVDVVRATEVGISGTPYTWPRAFQATLLTDDEHVYRQVFTTTARFFDLFEVHR